MSNVHIPTGLPPDKPANLFGWTDNPADAAYPQSPGWKDPTTSREAALAVASKAQTLRSNVLNLLLDASPDALSADQIAVRLQRSPLSIRPRVSELAALDLIERTKQRAKNDSGMTASTWRAKP